MSNISSAKSTTDPKKILLKCEPVTTVANPVVKDAMDLLRQISRLETESEMEKRGACMGNDDAIDVVNRLITEARTVLVRVDEPETIDVTAVLSEVTSTEPSDWRIEAHDTQRGTDCVSCLNPRSGRKAVLSHDDGYITVLLDQELIYNGYWAMRNIPM